MMQKVTTLVDGSLENLKRTAPLEKPSAEARPTPPRAVSCEICQDLGYVYRGTDGKAYRCACKAAEDNARRRELLLKLDGLTPAERQRRFEHLDDLGKEEVIAQVEKVAAEARGMVTLFGKPGLGKTTLLICAVNHGREQGKLAIYTTMSDLLSYLRSTFGPDSDDTFDKYWDALIRADILALDELDEFNATSWAMERFLRLIDERWRRMDEVLTLCATNVRLNALPGKVSSRLQDRRALALHLEGRDMRLMNEW